MTLTVHLMYEYTPDVVNYLRTQLAQNIQLTVGEGEEAESDCHILVGGRPTPELIAAKKNLRALIVPWTGIPPLTRRLMLDFPHISLHNIHHNSIPVAEMTLSLLLAAAKNVIPYDEALRRGDWSMRYQPPTQSMLLFDKHVLILGYGAIGRLVAQMCQSFGMHIMAVRRNIAARERDGFADEMHPADQLQRLLPRAQAVIVTLPLTPHTEGLIGAYELSLLPVGSILVNIGRAAVVDEAALYEALKSRRLGAAGLDVWYNYPEDEESRTNTLPATFPFWELDNVVLSPHRAGHAAETDTYRMDQLAVLLNAAAKDEQIPNRVDPHEGY